MTELKTFIAKWQLAINQQLAQDLGEIIPTTVNPALHEMMAYALLNPGKRLRPLLTLAVWKSFQVDITPAHLQLASVVEWVHAYSLVHDDLPDMDNDQYRRGQLSVHAKYGAANGILVGDALLTGAFQVATRQPKFPAHQLLQIVADLSHYAGATGMVGGQFYDMQNHQELTIDQEWLLEKVYSPKTAALIISAVLSAGRILELSDDALTTLKAFGKNFGLAFQIQDDLDDYQQDQTEQVQSLLHLVGLMKTRQIKGDLLQAARTNLAALQTAYPQFDRSRLDGFLNILETSE